LPGLPLEPPVNRRRRIVRSQGWRLLCAALAVDSIRSVARRIDRSPGTVGEWRSDVKTPDFASRIALWRALNIPPESWDRPEDDRTGDRPHEVHAIKAMPDRCEPP